MYIVTGGAGFIGSCVAAELVRRGSDVAIVDHLGVDGQWLNLRKDLSGDSRAPGRAADFVAAHGDAIEGVVHMGANSATTAVDGDAILASNVDASKFWWRWCAEANRPLVYASSAATYGDGANGFDDDDGPDALARLRPLNLYGWSKHYFDRWAVDSARRGEAPPFWAGLKFFNVYGPNEAHKGDMKSVVAKNYATVAGGEPVMLFRSHRPEYRDGGQLRDFVYVKDCVETILWLLAARPANGLYNVGSGEARSFADLIGGLGDALDTRPDIRYVDMPVAIRDKYQYYTRAEMTKLTAAGYPRKSTRLEDGIRDYVVGHLRPDEPY